MKLQDPGLEALLEAYRSERRPSAAQQRRMWTRFEESRRPRRGWMRVGAAVVVAVAAVVLLWLAGRGSSRVVAVDEGGAGQQAPYGRERGPGGQAVKPGDGRRATVVEPGAASVETPAVEAEGGEAPLPPRAPSSGVRAPAASARVDPPASDRDPDPDADALALVERAEAALRDGQPERALELLREHERRFAQAPTAQEREALRVLALCAAGRETEGRGARWAFLREHPRSAYRERIERACPSR